MRVEPVELYEHICPQCGARSRLCRPCRNVTTYCSPECSQQARRETWRKRGSEYQRSRRGRDHHWRRQRLYRERCRRREEAASKVTLHSSTASEPSVSMDARSSDVPAGPVARLRAEVTMDVAPVDHNRADTQRGAAGADGAGPGPETEGPPAAARAGACGAGAARGPQRMVPPPVARCARCRRRGHPVAPRALGPPRW